MTVEEICTKNNYFIDIPYRFGDTFFEYDIKQANINTLAAAGRIDMDKYNYLSQLPKQMREVFIGNWIREDQSVYTTIQSNINAAKVELCKVNKIEDPYSIIRVANDAMYISSQYPLKNPVVYINSFPIEFVIKNKFTSYMSFGKTIVFFNNNGDSWNVDVKGISDDALPLHTPFLSSICQIIQARELGGNKIALVEFNKYYTSYIQRSLPTTHYREFNVQSMFRLINNTLVLDHSVQPEYLNIEFNLMILRKMYTYLF